MAGDKPGAPTKYREEFASQAEELCTLGATDTEMADFFKVDVRTIYNWKHTFPAFFQALRVGKEACDDRVERALYQRAIGYEQDAVKIFMPAGAESPVYAPYRERVAPDVGAAKLWLTNRRGETWREKTEVDVNVNGDLLKAIEAGNKRVQGGNGAE
jgi:hypothetical protein